MVTSLSREAQVFGEVLDSFKTFFEFASKFASTPKEVKKMADISANLRRTAFALIQKTGSPELKARFAEARQSFSKSYGVALQNLRSQNY